MHLRCGERKYTLGYKQNLYRGLYYIGTAIEVIKG